MKSITDRIPSAGWFVTAGFTVVVVAFIYSVFYGWTTPFISEMFGFRQTQTALSVSTMLGGGPWLAYETPVLGSPWSIPFEFPLYQWLVALLVKSGTLTLASAGRLVGILFFAAAIYPCYRILRYLELSYNQSLAVLCLICSSAEYLFWTRTVMIESTALSLALIYLWLVLKYVKHERSEHENRFWLFAVVALAGSLAATVKVTTFFPFFCASAVIFVVRLHQGFTRDGWSGLFKILKGDGVFLLSSYVIPLIALFSWTCFTDSLKILNPLAVGLTSHALSGWNFGSMQQKLSYSTWQKFYSVTVTDVLGKSWLLPLSLLALVFCSARTRILAVTVLLFSFLHLATFTNLNLVHSYYAYAHGIFILAAAGIICADLAASNHWWKQLAGTALFVLITFFSWSHYFGAYWPKQGHNPDYFTLMKRDVEAYTYPDDVIVVFGWSWSSEPAYYLKRRAFMIGDDAFAKPNYQAMRNNLKNHRIGAVMLLRRSPEDQQLVEKVEQEFHLSSGTVFRGYPEGAVFYNVRGKLGRDEYRGIK